MNPKTIRSDLWRKIEKAVAILAEGVSLRAEVEYRMGLYGGPAKRVFGTMLREQFITQQIYPVIGWHKYAVVTLTDIGREAARIFLSLQARPSEWQLLAEKHSAEEYQRHALSVLVFAYHARRRGWKVQICPETASSLYLPDVLVEKDGERVYVEVEVLRHPRKRKDGADNTWVRKWINQHDFQKQVAVCTLTPKRREGIRAYLKPRWRGMATDILTLATNPNGDLWAERWEWPNRKV